MNCLRHESIEALIDYLHLPVSLPSRKSIYLSTLPILEESPRRLVTHAACGINAQKIQQTVQMNFPAVLDFLPPLSLQCLLHTYPSGCLTAVLVRGDFLPKLRNEPS